ncbi:vacuolar protein sorting-associated protein 37A [Cephus cinctus]|uniref:Vacuolar protein sorting-associated protein 37A n=1 Tax=Cephus cinctus TaxID=211228 RepID=A0AAJ7RNP2_CEPCN|nr:vacuolar protein sorting-associated protein 37A [Cephus cinctus]XP_024943784.1 vacuolar protein sorting-associated protein 37A [Cephus cinctus]XP_024943787.1 vacuolar protein sorting-associated protein 37A [Cephus cinctus]
MLSQIFRGETENAAVKRKRQINTLKIFNANVIELKEDVEYQVQFDAGDKRMAIMVSLTPEFPLEKPFLRVSPPITHPWCNEHSEITSAPGLLNFTVHSDLGRVVQAIIREFSKNPPQLLEDSPPATTIPHRDLQERASPSYALQQYIDLPSTSYNSYYDSQYPLFSSSNTNTSVYNYNYTNSGNTYNSNSQTNSFAVPSHHSTYIANSGSSTLHRTNPTHYSTSQHASSYLNSHFVNANYGQSVQSHVQTKAPQSLVFPELNNLNNEELKKLSEDEDRLDEFLENHSQLKDINAAVEDAIDWVEKTATANLTKEPELKQLRDEVAEKIETVTTLKARYDQLIQRYNKLSEVFTPDHIKECMKQAADESHERSEKIAEDFLNRKIDVERFLSTYIECRKLGQARRTKEEKLAHQLNELKRAGY